MAWRLNLHLSRTACCLHLPTTSCIDNHHEPGAHHPAFCHGFYGSTVSKTALRRTTPRRKQKTENGSPRPRKDPEDDGGRSSPSCRCRREDRHYEGRRNFTATATTRFLSCTSIRGPNSCRPFGCYESTRDWGCLSLCQHRCEPAEPTSCDFIVQPSPRGTGTG